MATLRQFEKFDWANKLADIYRSTTLKMVKVAICRILLQMVKL